MEYPAPRVDTSFFSRRVVENNQINRNTILNSYWREKKKKAADVETGNLIVFSD